MEKKVNDFITLDYIISPEYKEYYATGVWGGLKPDKNDLQIVFYDDVLKVPDSTKRRIVNVNENGYEIEAKEIGPETTIVRSIKSTVIVPVEFIPKFIEWLRKFNRTSANGAPATKGKTK